MPTGIVWYTQVIGGGEGGGGVAGGVAGGDAGGVLGVLGALGGKNLEDLLDFSLS